VGIGFRGIDMTKKPLSRHNKYNCCVEINQNGKYCVRIRAHFARHDWDLPVYFLASTFDRAIRRLEQVFQFLQREEDRLWFWGVDRSDDPNVAADMLRESGLNLDRRGEFPRRAEHLALGPEHSSVSPFQIAALRRGLVQSVSSGRAAAAAAGN
jgi:hypothetical protein